MRKFLILLMLSADLLFAGTTGKLSGEVKDANTGEVLFGANVLIQNTTLGAAADKDGKFIILNIPPGKYSVKVSYLGYEKTIIENVKIIVDQTTYLPVELKTKSIEVGEVVVTAKAPMIHKDITSTISVISREKIEALPVSTFTDLLSLQAGVVGSGSNLHIRGGRSDEVAYLIDGTYVEDPLLGGLATQLNNDAIQEMSLLSGTFNAEYGNALSGVVNIVTRDGSDKFSGRISYRSSEFGITRYNALHQMRLNGSLSGPVFSKYLNFFISGEENKEGSYLPFGYNKDLIFFTKLNTSSIPDLKIAVTNRGSLGRRQNYSHDYKYIPDQYLRRRTDSWQSAISVTHTIANNFFYNIKISYFNQGYYSGVNKDTSQYITSSQFQYFSQYGNGFEFYQLANPLELTDSRTATGDIKGDAVWQVDDINEVKFGLAYKKHWLRYFNIYDPNRDYPYINDYHTNPFEAAGYVQDKIELPYLILNLGLRYDYLNANVEFRQNPLDPNSVIKVKPRSQISPRIGIAHPISDRTKIHFAYGHFFQNPEFQPLFENHQYDLNVREPLFGQANLDAQRTVAYEVGISHQFSDRVALDVTAYYKDVTGLIGTHYYLPYHDGRFVGYTLYVNEDYANIKGFEIDLNIRPDRYFGGSLTYTYSIAKGSASSETEQYPGTQESTQLYYLDFDKTHVFNATGTFMIPQGEGPEVFGSKIFDNMDFSLIIQASSGYPYTPSGRDVGFVEKNSLRMPGAYNIDLMIGKQIPIPGFEFRIFAEILNLTDHRNILYVYPDTGDPDFTFVGGHSTAYMQDPSNYGPPRYIRLGAEVKF